MATFIFQPTCDTTNYEYGLIPATPDTHSDPGMGGQFEIGSYYNRESIIRFDTSDVPANATVTSATLSLYGASNNPYTIINITRVLATWNKDTVTWNSKDTGVSWNTAGALGSGTDISSTNMATDVWYNATGWIDTSLNTTETEAMLADNKGILIHQTGAGPGYWIYDTMSYGTSTLRPKLTIVTEADEIISPFPTHFVI